MTPRPQPVDRFPALDGLRGIAILLVLAFHFGLRFEPANAVEAAVRRVLDIGWIGVDLFFVLSGFLITRILYEARTAPRYFQAFYIRRALRIFPLYYAFIGGYVLLLPHLLPGHPGTIWLLEQQEWWWLYASNIFVALNGWNAAPHYTSPMWSLAVEEQFYLLWPLFILAVPRRHDRWCLAVVAAAAAARVLIHATGWELGAMVLMPTRMDAFAIGGWVAIVFQRGDGERLLNGLHRSMPVAGAVVVICWLLSPRPQEGGFAPWNIAGFLASAVLFAACLVPAIQAQSGPFKRLGSAPVLRWFGQHAYGLYVFHNPVRLLLDELALDPPGLNAAGVPRLAAAALFAALGMTLSMLLAALSWRYFEAPILGLKRYFPLLVPQRLDRIEAGGAERRDHAEEDAGRRGEPEADGERLPG